MSIKYKDVHPLQDLTKTYQIKNYPEPKDETLEALNLLSSAHGLFFGIAENGVGVNKTVRDPETLEPITDRKEAAELVLKNRIKLCEEIKDDKFALAKLAGAHVHILGIIADKLTEIYLKDKSKRPDTTEMEEHYKAAYDLLPNIRLKGRKADIDGVLNALLGEVFKTGIAWGVKAVRKNNDQKAADTMYETDMLVHWMEDIITANPKLEPCRKLIQDLGIAAKERLSMGRDDLARDKPEIEVRLYSRLLRKKLREILVSHDGPEKLVEHSRDLRRGSEVIFDMLKEGEKRVTTTLVMSIEQARTVSRIIKKLPSLLTPMQQTQQVSKQVSQSLINLQTAVREHLERILNDGEPNEVLQKKFAKALKAAKEAADGINTSKAVKGDKILSVKQGILEGIELISKIPETFLLTDKEVEERRKENKRETLFRSKAAIVESRRDILKEVNTFIDSYGQNNKKSR